MEIGEVDVSFISGFPDVGFNIRDLKQTSTDTIFDKKSSVNIKNAWVSIAAKDLLKGDIQFKTLRISEAKIISEVVTDKSREQYIELKERLQNSEKGLKLPDWIHRKNSSFTIDHLNFVSRNELLNKSFDIEIEHITGTIYNKGDRMTGNLNFKLIANELGFNTQKGSYINGDAITASPKFILDKNSNVLKLPGFELKIGNQNFNTEAEFAFEETPHFKFQLENDETDFSALKRVLPDSISAKLEKYQVGESFYTKLDLQGDFSVGNIPIIEAKFHSKNNNVRIYDDLEITNVNFSGGITNTFASEKPGRKDIRVFFDELNGNIKDIRLKAGPSYYQTSESVQNQITANLLATGSNTTLAQALNATNYNFSGGNFRLQAKIDGDLPNMYQAFDHARGTFVLQNTKVQLQENKLQLPVEMVELNLNKQFSEIKHILINLENGDALHFTGTIKNLSSVLVDDPDMPAKVNVKLESERIDIDNLIQTATSLFTETERSRTQLKTLHQAIAAIYQKFQPEFQMSIQDISYRNQDFKNLMARVALANSETINFHKLAFDYREAQVNAEGKIIVPEPQDSFREPVFIDILVHSSGEIKVFQKLFNLELVELQDGEFIFDGEFNGNIQQFEELLQNARGKLSVRNVAVKYPEAQLGFKLDSLLLDVQHSDVSLKRFAIEAQDHHPFYLSADVKNYPTFLMGNLSDEGAVAIKLEAEFIDLDQWMRTVDRLEPDSTQTKTDKTHISTIFRDIYRFKPSLQLKVDSLKFNNLLSEKIKADFSFINDSVLNLNEFQLNFKDSRAIVNGHISASDPTTEQLEENPFNFQFSTTMQGKSRDLNDLLNTINFNIRSGDFKFSASYSGQSKDLEILNANFEGDLQLASTVVDVNETDISIPVDSLHLNIRNDLAILDRLDINLPGKSAIDITGKIDRFSNFINNDGIGTHTSTFDVKADYLSTKDIQEFVGTSSRPNDSLPRTKFDMEALKNILKNINRSYYPSANIMLDTIVINDLKVTDFATHIGYEKNGRFHLSNTTMDYLQGNVQLSFNADVEAEKALPVSIKSEIKDLDVGRIMKDLNYLNIESLKNADTLSGKIDLILDVEGLLENNGKIDMNSLNGSATIHIEELALYNFKPVMRSIKLMKEERFEHLRFQPISQTFQVRDGKILIPRTQVQSSALHVFIEGELRLDDYMNVWLSIPWKNLKKNDGLSLPEKVKYEEAGSKFYLQMQFNKKSLDPKQQKLRTRLRLSNRKLRKKD